MLKSQSKTFKSLLGHLQTFCTGYIMVHGS